MIAPERFAPGMALQLRRFHDARAKGMPRRGWKIGINVPEVLRQLDLPHPGLGWLHGGRVFSSGAVLEAPPGTALHVEPEVALELSAPVAPGCSADAARSSIRGVSPALEVVDYAKPGAGLDDVVAHCMFHEAAVIGGFSPLSTARELGGRWPRLIVGGRHAESPRDDLVPEDLGTLAAFAASFLSAFGETLAAGDLLLSGSYTTRALAVASGEEVVADFGPLGTVTMRVSRGEAPR